MSEVIADLTAEIRRFAEERDWERFHTPKNLAMALVVEASEVVELFQWMTPEESVAAAGEEAQKAALASEIADVAIYLLRLADVAGVDVVESITRKMAANRLRFDIQIGNLQDAEPRLRVSTTDEP